MYCTLADPSPTEEASRFTRLPITLERLTEAQIAELKVILKVDAELSEPALDA